MDFAAADGQDAKERGGKQGGKEHPHEIRLGLFDCGGRSVSFLVVEETIADSADCIEEAAGGIEFFAQAVDVHVHCSCVD